MTAEQLKAFKSETRARLNRARLAAGLPLKNARRLSRDDPRVAPLIDKIRRNGGYADSRREHR